MIRHFTEDARAIAEQAFEHAVRLGHPYFGGEHFLLALSAASQPPGIVLREHGVTPERVEAEIARLSGGGLFGDLDRAALAAVRVDVDTVRTMTEASLGRETLARAARAAHRKPPWFDLRPRSGAWRTDGVYLPHGPSAMQAQISATRRARTRDATQPATIEDLALGILAISEGLVPVILSALAVSAPALSTAIQVPA